MTPDNQEPGKGEMFIPNRSGRRAMFAMMRQQQRKRGPNVTPKKKKRK